MWAVARPPARRPDFLPLLRRGRSSKGIKKETGNRVEWLSLGVERGGNPRGGE